MTNSVHTNDSPDEIARKSAEAMLSQDNATKHLGMVITEIKSGAAVVTMPIKDFMLNGHGTCHGGYIFTLADSCFAFACNSHNRKAVAFYCSINFLAPAREGDFLTARGQERNLSGRNGIYDIEIINQNNQTIAEFRGLSRMIEGNHYE